MASSKRYRRGQSLSHFLRYSLLFYPQSPELIPASEACLRLDALWIKEYAEIRIGAPWGIAMPRDQEACTHELAEKRSAVVKDTVLKYGVDSSQIAGVRGWEDADPTGEATTATCQEMNRRARIFIAASTCARKERAGSHPNAP